MPSFIFETVIYRFPVDLVERKKRTRGRGGEKLCKCEFPCSKKRGKIAKEIPLVVQPIFKCHLWIFFPVVEQAVLVYMHLLFLYRGEKNPFSSLISRVHVKCAVYCWKGCGFFEVSVVDEQRESKPKVTESSRGSSKIWYFFFFCGGDRWCFSLK